MQSFLPIVSFKRAKRLLNAIAVQGRPRLVAEDRPFGMQPHPFLRNPLCFGDEEHDPGSFALPLTLRKLPASFFDVPSLDPGRLEWTAAREPDDLEYGAERFILHQLQNFVEFLQE